MIPSVRHMKGPAGRRMLVVSLLVAAVLAFADGARTTAAAETANRARTTAAAKASDGVESAGSERFNWAIRDLNVQVLSERVSERKPISERGFDSDATRPIPVNPPAHSIARAASYGHAVPPRLLYYLHGALLI